MAIGLFVVIGLLVMWFLVFWFFGWWLLAYSVMGYLVVGHFLFLFLGEGGEAMLIFYIWLLVVL